MSVGLGATRDGGRIGWSVRRSADATDVEGRAVRGAPQGLTGRYIRAGALTADAVALEARKYAARWRLEVQSSA